MRSIPCGRTTGHGESCTHDWLCDHCTDTLTLKQELASATEFSNRCANSPVGQVLIRNAALENLITEADEYLDGHPDNCIGHKSILHRKFKALGERKG